MLFRSTVADHLCYRHGYTQLAFADPVYRAVSAATGIPVRELQNRSNKEAEIDWLGVSPRYLLQTLGTEWGRQSVRDDIWVQIAMRKVDGMEPRHVVLTDVRFENEAAAIKARGGVIWRVVRRGDGCLSRDAAGHASEAGVPDILVDSVISNCGTLSDLRAATDDAIRRLDACKMTV